MRLGHGCAATLLLLILAWAALPPQVATAQDQPSPDQLKKMYDDALAQLKTAQDRKNELAVENEKLTARITELTKNLEESRKQAAGYAEQTFYLRSHYAAWQNFVRKYPALRQRWIVFLEAGLLDSPHDVSEIVDPDWPAFAAPAEEPGATTQPSTTQAATTSVPTTAEGPKP